MNRTVPEYKFALNVEKNFDRVKSHIWIDHYFWVPVFGSVVYVIIVLLGPHLMKSRKSRSVQTCLIIWNTLLAVFSVSCCVRLFPEFLYSVQNFGWKHSMCKFSFYDDSPVSAFWSYLFTLSKLAELGDTAFLILRKRNIQFLHWFHHCTVLVFTWFLLKDKAAVGRWFMNMNALVHSVMYAYYAITALQLKIPKALAACITSTQIMQMIVGMFISVQGFRYWIAGEECDISGTAAISAIIIYTFYFALFLNFFTHAYLLPKARSKPKSS